MKNYERCVFVSSRPWDKENILGPHQESNFRPSDLRSDVLALSHRDSSVSEVYYEVHMTRVLHTARISNVDSVMFLDRNSRDGKFWARSRIKKDVFSSCHKCGTKKYFKSPWGIEPQTFRFALRCSSTEPQRLFGERGLLRSSYDTRPAYCTTSVGQRKSCELSYRPRSPKILCSSVLEHRSANPKVWGSIPHGDLEYFLCPTLVTRRKHIFLQDK